MNELERVIADACLGARAGDAIARDLRGFLEERGVAADDVDAIVAAPHRLAVYRSLVRNGLEGVVEFEKALHQALAIPGDGPRYTALCHWDERRHLDERQAIADPDMDAVRAIHPVSVIPRPGTLHACWADNGIRLTGDSDLSTREDFAEAIRALEGLFAPADAPAGPLLLDISDLSFLDAHSAGMILRMAAALPPHRRLEVRCRAHHRRLLHMLGARGLRQLSIITSRLA